MTPLDPAEQHHHANRVTCVAFAPDGALLATGYDAVVLRERNAERWRIDQDRDDIPTLWHAAYSPDGTTIVAGGYMKHLVVLDPTTGAVVSKLPARSNVFSVAFAHDGSFATGERPELQIWKPGASKPAHVIVAGKATKVYTPYVSSIGFSRDGKRLVVSCGKTVLVFDVSTGAELYKATGDRFGVSAAVFAHDDTIVSTGSQATIDIRDPSKKGKKPLRSFPSKSAFDAFALSADGTKLLTGGKQVQLWDLAKGTVIATLRGPKQGVDAVALSRDCKRAAAGGLDNTVFVWNL